MINEKNERRIHLFASIITILVGLPVVIHYGKQLFLLSFALFAIAPQSIPIKKSLSSSDTTTKINIKKNKQYQLITKTENKSNKMSKSQKGDIFNFHPNSSIVNKSGISIPSVNSFNYKATAKIQNPDVMPTSIESYSNNSVEIKIVDPKQMNFLPATYDVSRNPNPNKVMSRNGWGKLIVRSLSSGPKRQVEVSIYSTDTLYKNKAYNRYQDNGWYSGVTSSNYDSSNDYRDEYIEDYAPGTYIVYLNYAQDSSKVFYVTIIKNKVSLCTYFKDVEIKHV